MGSKEKRRRRSKSPSPASYTGSSDSSAERRDKKSKKHKHKHKKHKKHSKDIDAAKIAAAKAVLEQHLRQTADAEGPIGNSKPTAALVATDVAAAGGSRRDRKKSREKPAGHLPAGTLPLTADDYFERSGEFTAWLQEVKGTYFNELTTQQSHEQFGEFVIAWNGGQLPMRFYQGLAAPPIKRTSHNWNFKSKLPEQQQQQPSVQRGMAAFLDDQQQQRAEERLGAAVERRSWRREQKDLLDEMLPKATGREARVEGRIARREEAKAREASPELMTVTGGGSIMGGDDSFAAAKAREAKRQEWRAKQQAVKKEELTSKLSAAAQAEADKMAQFRALLAAQGGSITIPKRQQQ
eukprot:gene4090-4337_t